MRKILGTYSTIAFFEICFMLDRRKNKITRKRLMQIRFNQNAISSCGDKHVDCEDRDNLVCFINFMQRRNSNENYLELVHIHFCEIITCSPLITIQSRNAINCFCILVFLHNIKHVISGLVAYRTQLPRSSQWRARRSRAQQKAK